MDITGKPNHIEDYLVTVRTGQWFGWSNSKNKVYANLIVHDGGDKPTEEQVNAGLQAMLDEWNEENQPYRISRETEYPTWQDQMDMQYHDKKDGTTTWEDAIQAVKEAHPKP